MDGRPATRCTRATEAAWNGSTGGGSSGGGSSHSSKSSRKSGGNSSSIINIMPVRGLASSTFLSHLHLVVVVPVGSHVRVVAGKPGYGGGAVQVLHTEHDAAQRSQPQRERARHLPRGLQAVAEDHHREAAAGWCCCGCGCCCCCVCGRGGSFGSCCCWRLLFFVFCDNCCNGSSSSSSRAGLDVVTCPKGRRHLGSAAVVGKRGAVVGGDGGALPVAKQRGERRRVAQPRRQPKVHVAGLSAVRGRGERVNATQPWVGEWVGEWGGWGFHWRTRQGAALAVEGEAALRCRRGGRTAWMRTQRMQATRQEHHTVVVGLTVEHSLRNVPHSAARRRRAPARIPGTDDTDTGQIHHRYVVGCQGCCAA
jgi:hypothetical protein